jgi:thiamine-phosphate pyrophosphorylase
MNRYAITSRGLFGGDAAQQQAALVEQTARWADHGIDLIQLREKDLPGQRLAQLARSILNTVPATTRLLINSRADVAIAVAAHGVHLTAGPDELTPRQVRALYSAAGLAAPLITVSCQSVAQVEQILNDQKAVTGQTDFPDGRVDAILFAPVFGKVIAGRIVSAAQGLDRLQAACIAAAPTPVYALGGVTLENAGTCLDAGAGGIAGIRLFHDL